MSKLYSLKYFATFLLVLAIFHNVNAQRNGIIRNQGTYLTFEPNAGIGLNLVTNYPKIINGTPFNVGFKTTFNSFINYNVSWGLGLGYTHYENPGMNTIPITLNLKYFGNKTANSYFFYSEAGFAPRLKAGKQNKGFLYELGVGYRLRSKKNNMNFILVKLGYNAFKTNEWVWDIRYGDYTEEDPYKWYYLKRRTINLTISLYKGAY